MAEYESGNRDKVINLKSRKFRKKHRKLFNIIDKLCGIFHKSTGGSSNKREIYKRTVNH